jgi:hypothetical protein
MHFTHAMLVTLLTISTCSVGFASKIIIVEPTEGAEVKLMEDKFGIEL